MFWGVLSFFRGFFGGVIGCSIVFIGFFGGVLKVF